MRGVLAARNISKSHGDAVIFERLSLTVTPGSRIGLVGPNGIGKSTLLAVLAGVEQPDDGVVSREPSDLAVVYLPQETASTPRSGGEAARRQLERVLAAGASMVLLDEPTNDLDAAGLELLEGFVERHPGGVVAVSHDRAFLESMTTIVEFEPETRRVRTYSGGWSEFDAERRRAREREEQSYRSYAATRARIEQQARRMREWERRGYGQGRNKKKTKDVAKSFERKLSRVEMAEKPFSPWRLELDLPARARSGDVVVRLERAVAQRGRFVLGPIDLDLARGERLAILGGNGAGKTTLLAALLGELPLSSGSRWVGPSVVFGAIPQGSRPWSDPRPLLAQFTARSPLPPQQARSLLAKFGLGADHVRRAGASLSPGERTRATLALLVSRGVNTLILDEPTNHLDLEAIEQLESALGAFEGTVVLVTHDRRFRDAFDASRTIALAPPRAPRSPARWSETRPRSSRAGSRPGS